VAVFRRVLTWKLVASARNWAHFMARIIDGAPMGVSQLLLALWLIATGFRSQASMREAAAEHPDGR
jgi:hypothetical protein